MSSQTSPPDPTQRLYRIVEEGLCIGCGLCQSVAGGDRVRMMTVTNGYERPVVVNALDHETIDRIYDTCPSLRLEGLPERDIDPETQHDLVWGPYRRMVRAYAADPDVRFRASTGGVLTALGQYLLASGAVSLILHARASEREPTFGEATISRTPADVLAAAGSRYGPTAPLVDIHGVLDEGEPFALIAKPCDVAAVRNLAEHEPRVDRLMQYALVMVCGGFMPPPGMDRFLREDEGVDPDDVRAFRYRGYGCPGPTRYELADGTLREQRYTDFWGTDETQWQLPFRCKICPDGIGEAADVAAADDWPGGSPDPVTEDDDPGTNAVVVRTARGEALVQDAVAAGYLVVENDVDPRYMDGVQPHQVKKKQVVRSRWDGLAAEGRLVPKEKRLRLDALSDTIPAPVRENQTAGTRERIRNGKADEPTPIPRSIRSA